VADPCKTRKKRLSSECAVSVLSHPVWRHRRRPPVRRRTALCKTQSVECNRPKHTQKVVLSANSFRMGYFRIFQFIFSEFFSFSFLIAFSVQATCVMEGLVYLLVQYNSQSIITWIYVKCTKKSIVLSVLHCESQIVLSSEQYSILYVDHLCWIVTASFHYVRYTTGCVVKFLIFFLRLVFFLSIWICCDKNGNQQHTIRTNNMA